MSKKSKRSFGIMVVILGITYFLQCAHAQDNNQLRAEIEICLSGLDCFDAHAIYFGASQTASGQVGGGSAAGRVSMDDIALTRNPDKFSPILLLNNASGRHITKAKITIRMLTSQGLLLNSMWIKMSDILISSYRLEANNGEYPVERLTINFSKIEMVVKDSAGQVIGEAGWNLKENREE